jgi:cytochrome P450
MDSLQAAFGNKTQHSGSNAPANLHFPFGITTGETIMVVYLEFHLKLIFLLVAAVLSLTSAWASIRRFLVRRRFAHAHGCQPVARSLNKDLLLGLDALPRTIRAVLQHRILECTCERFRVFGNTFTVKELQRRAILTVEPENIKTILSVKFKDYGINNRLEPFQPLLGKGIFDTDGDHWASSRALIRPSFTRDQVADLTTFEGLIQDLFKLLPRDGKTTIDLQDLYFRYTIDSATEFLFGQSVGTLKKTQSDVDFAHAFHYAQRAVIMRGMLGPLKIFYLDRKADECNCICRDFPQQFVEEAFRAVAAKKEGEENPEAEMNQKKHIFSQELASRTSDKIRVLDELMNVLLAGRDTTASLLSNLFFSLAKNPAIWDKLRREVAGLHGRAPTYGELRSLRYVRCCMNECE